nr:MAG TPA: hypothetical protein [Caudoviricetes sp.]
MVATEKLFNAFFVLLESDEWEGWRDDYMEQDLTALMMAAIPFFKFPRCSLEVTEDGKNFVDDNITNTEIQILAHYMKYAWLGRVVDSWENLRPLYTERDFSPAQQLSEFRARQTEVGRMAKELEATYYRSRNCKPFDYTTLAGV